MAKYLYKYLSSEPRHGMTVFVYSSNLETHEEVEEEIANKYKIEPLMLQERTLISND